MATIIPQLATSLAGLKNQVVQWMTTRDAKINKLSSTKVLAGEVTIDPSDEHTLDIVALIGGQSDGYELTKVAFSVSVRDDEASSPTYQRFVNAAAVLSYGTAADNLTAFIYNQSIHQVVVRYRLEVPADLSE
ncbi:hypothetical protein ACLPJK_25890 [Pseudomonas aeruginosa]|uniref:hypothetical protein n=1 Tax=Pseudomonas aeruginosa TaxID=287 RepID=UPI003D284DF3